jgi:hypothetical protein
MGAPRCIAAAVLLLGVGVASADRVAPVDDTPRHPPDPDDGEPRLITSEPEVAPQAEAQASHKGQFGLAVSLVTGGRFIKTYDKEFCGDRDTNGGTSGNATYCLGRVPVSVDLAMSYGLTPRIELLFELRLGLERDFAGNASSSNGPRLRHYSPGVKFYFSERGLLKFFSTAQVAIDSTGYTDPSGDDLGADFTLRNANGMQLDFHDAYGAYLFFAEEAAFKRWISVGVEVGVGFQGRYP